MNQAVDYILLVFCCYASRLKILAISSMF